MLSYRNLEDFVCPGVETCHLAVDPYQGAVVKVERFDHGSSVIEKVPAMADSEDAEGTKHVTQPYVSFQRANMTPRPKICARRAAWLAFGLIALATLSHTATVPDGTPVSTHMPHPPRRAIID